MPFEPAHQADVRSQMGRDLRRNAQKTVFDARQRLTSSSAPAPPSISNCSTNTPDSRISSALVLPMMFGILALFSSLWVPALVAAGWAALVAAANTRRRPRRPAVQTQVAPAQFNAGRWTATFITVETIYGVCLVLLALVLAGSARITRAWPS